MSVIVSRFRLAQMIGLVAEEDARRGPASGPVAAVRSEPCNGRSSAVHEPARYSRPGDPTDPPGGSGRSTIEPRYVVKLCRGSTMPVTIAGRAPGDADLVYRSGSLSRPVDCRRRLRRSAVMCDDLSGPSWSVTPIEPVLDRPLRASSRGAISATVARPLSRSVRSFSITCSNSDPTSTYSRYGSSARRSKTHFFLFESTAFLADEADGAGANLFRAYEADGSSTDRRPVRRGRFRIGMEAVVGHDVAIRPDADLSGLAVPPRRQSHSAAVPTISPRKRQPLGRLAAERRDGREAVCVDSRRRGDEWVGVREEEEVGGFDPIPVAATTVDAFVGSRALQRLIEPRLGAIRSNQVGSSARSLPRTSSTIRRHRSSPSTRPQHPRRHRGLAALAAAGIGQGRGATSGGAARRHQAKPRTARIASG